LGDDVQASLEKMNFNLPEVNEANADNVSAQQMGTPLFELYLALHEFCSFKEQLSGR
jgi:hypothetical protein